MTRNQRNKSRRKPGLTVSSGTNVTREPAAYTDTTCSNTRRAPMAHSRCRADSKLAYLGLLVSDETDAAPTEAEYQEFDKLKKQTDDYLAHWAELQKTDLASFQKIMAGQNIQAIVVPTAEATSAGGEEPR